MEREDKRSIRFPVIKITQPIGEFYIGVIDCRVLYSISWVDIRRIFREREIESYLGIQRPLDPKRVKTIGDYVKTIDATFPTAVILAVDEVCASIEFYKNDGIENQFGIMTLSNYPEAEDENERVLFGNIAKIIDGQHRIAGLREFEKGNFEVNISLFVGAEISDQADIFSTVNLAQTKVNRSLVYDLFELANARSPQKTCHEIVVALDGDKTSPFFEKIKRLGVATEGRVGETISQATFVKMLLPYISSNPDLDRDLSKRRKKLFRAEGKEAEKLIFRNFFIDERDLEIADIIWNYFDAIKERWPNAWASTGKGMILNRTNGFRAFMRFLRPAYLFHTTSEEVVETAQFLSLLKKISLKDEDFNSDRFPPGTSGETGLFRELKDQTRLS